MHAGRREVQAVTVVVGSNATGSAIAHRLHATGLAVVLLDDVDPPWTRRGHSYTDAWYYGVAELAGTPAVFCASVRSIPAALDRGRAIAATTWSAGGVASALRPLVVVDARFAEPCAATRGEVTIRPVADAQGTGSDWQLEVVPARSSGALHAPESGRFYTRLAIGDAVRAGEPVGMIGARDILAATAGRLVGLAARGARVQGGSVVAEVDARAEHDACFGLEPWAAAAADQVLSGLRERYRL
jgi:CBS domain-containing protein